VLTVSKCLATGKDVISEIFDSAKYCKLRVTLDRLLWLVFGISKVHSEDKSDSITRRT